LAPTHQRIAGQFPGIATRFQQRCGSPGVGFEEKGLVLRENFESSAFRGGIWSSVMQRHWRNPLVGFKNEVIVWCLLALLGWSPEDPS
jgi:hypothetical protein